MGDAPLTFSRVDQPPKSDDRTLAVVTEALLPVLLLRRVNLLRHIDEALTVGERFIIEAALLLGRVSAELVEEVTDLPVDAARLLADRLAEFGLLRPAGTGYDVNPEAAEATLRRGTLRLERTDACSVVVLPRTGEMLGLGVPLVGKHRRGQPAPRFDSVSPAGFAPMPAWLLGRLPSEVVMEGYLENRLVGLPADVQDVFGDPGEAPIGERCPAYRVVGVVGGDPARPRVILRAYDGEADREGRLRVDLSGATRLAAGWTERVDVPGTAEGRDGVLAVMGCTAAADVETRRSGPIEWTFRLGGWAAEEVAGAGLLLTDRCGIAVSDEESVVEIALRLEPADPAAAFRFAVDHAVDRLLQVPEPTDVDLDRARADGCQAFGLDDGAIAGEVLLDRLWALHRYELLYALRRGRDFAYA